MNIADIRQAGKHIKVRLNSLSFNLQKERLRTMLKKVPKDVLVVIVLLLSSITSFGLGMLTGKHLGQGGVIIETLPIASASQNAITKNTAQSVPVNKHKASFHGQVVASKNGSRYYLPNCSGAKRLSPAHRIWFSSASKARAHGYTPSVRCKGL